MSLLTYALLTYSLLTQDTLRLRPVVVTATRVPVSADAVASAVTVVTGDALRARGLRTVGEALRAIPGAMVVETGSLGGHTSLFLRGGESDYVKVLRDGVPLNLPGGSLDLADVTLDNVDRIEIVRGPGSVLYGSDAVTGVVQIFTRAGLGPPRLEVHARMGRYGTTEIGAQAAGGGVRVAWNVGAFHLVVQCVAPGDRAEANRAGDSQGEVVAHLGIAIEGPSGILAGVIRLTTNRIGRRAAVQGIQVAMAHRRDEVAPVGGGGDAKREATPTPSPTAVPYVPDEEPTPRNPSGRVTTQVMATCQLGVVGAARRHRGHVVHVGAPVVRGGSGASAGEREPLLLAAG